MSQEDWRRVDQEVIGITGDRILRKGSVSNFFVNFFGLGHLSQRALELNLRQRESLYRLGAAAYASRKWPESMEQFKLLDQLNVYGLADFPSIRYEGGLTQYQQKRGLKGHFVDYHPLLNDCLYHASEEALKQRKLKDSVKYFQQIPI